MNRLKAALVVGVVGIAAGGTYAYSQANELPDDVAFRVGDEMVTVDQLEKDMDTLRALYGVQPPESDAELDRYWRDAAKSQAVTRILDDAARDRGIVISEKSARDALSRFISDQIGTGPQAYDRFVQALGAVGTNEDAVLDELKRQLALNQLFDQVTAGQTVTDAEVRRAFAERRAELATPERRVLRNIVVRTKADAARVLAEIEGGAPFAEVARRRSLDASTRQEGGRLGAVSRHDLDARYAEAAFAAGQGAIFGPVRSQFGWNVGIVERVLPLEPADFQRSRRPLKQALLVEKATAEWRDWLTDQIRSADVDYADEYRPADPDAPPDESAPGGPAPETPR